MVQELATGPMNAGIFPNRAVDPTLNPGVLFFHGPATPGDVSSWAEAKRWFNFGTLEVDADGDLTIQVVTRPANRSSHGRCRPANDAQMAARSTSPRASARVHLCGRPGERPSWPRRASRQRSQMGRCCTPSTRALQLWHLVVVEVAFMAHSLGEPQHEVIGLWADLRVLLE